MLMIHPQWLASFRQLAELGNFTRVAERLDLTQAAISQHIRQLEDRLGTLLIRRPRGIELTPAGLALLDYCRDVDRADNALKLRLSDVDALEGEVSLITPGSIGLSLYPLLLALQQSHPGLVIRHRFAPDAEVREAVLESRYEIGLMSLRPDDESLAAKAFTTEAWELVVPAGTEVTRWDDLARLGFIDHPDGQAMATRLLARRFPGSRGLNGIRVTGFSNQIGLILEPVARGLGFTVIPEHARRAFARQEAIAVVACDDPVVDTLWLVQRTEWPLSMRAARVVGFLQDRLASPDGFRVSHG
jgi:DNA-binding transcriptional LysR family regulator